MALTWMAGGTSSPCLLHRGYGAPPHGRRSTGYPWASCRSLWSVRWVLAGASASSQALPAFTVCKRSQLVDARHEKQGICSAGTAGKGWGCAVARPCTARQGRLDLSNGHNPPRIESAYVLPLWWLNGIRGSGQPTDVETLLPATSIRKGEARQRWQSFRASGVPSKPT
jgi:hypothetical protein